MKALVAFVSIVNTVSCQLSCSYNMRIGIKNAQLKSTYPILLYQICKILYPLIVTSHCHLRGTLFYLIIAILGNYNTSVSHIISADVLWACYLWTCAVSLSRLVIQITIILKLS